MLKYRRVIPNPTRTIMWLGNPMRTCLHMQNMGLWEYENSNRSYWIEYNSCFPLLSLTSGIVVSGLPLPHMRNELAYDNWLAVLTILKNISQWEGLSHILWKIKNVWNHQPVMFIIRDHQGHVLALGKYHSDLQFNLSLANSWSAGRDHMLKNAKKNVNIFPIYIYIYIYMCVLCIYIYINIMHIYICYAHI